MNFDEYLVRYVLEHKISTMLYITPKKTMDEMIRNLIAAARRDYEEKICNHGNNRR